MAEHHSVSEILALIGSQWGKLQDGTSNEQIERLIELATQQAKDQEQQLAQAREQIEHYGKMLDEVRQDRIDLGQWKEQARPLLLRSNDLLQPGFGATDEDRKQAAREIRAFLAQHKE